MFPCCLLWWRWNGQASGSFSLSWTRLATLPAPIPTVIQSSALNVLFSSRFLPIMSFSNCAGRFVEWKEKYFWTFCCLNSVGFRKTIRITWVPMYHATWILTLTSGQQHWRQLPTSSHISPVCKSTKTKDLSRFSPLLFLEKLYNELSVSCIMAIQFWTWTNKQDLKLIFSLWCGGVRYRYPRMSSQKSFKISKNVPNRIRTWKHGSYKLIERSQQTWKKYVWGKVWRNTERYGWFHFVFLWKFPVCVWSFGLKCRAFQHQRFQFF